MRDGCRTRPAADERERDVDLMGGRRVVGGGIEGVEQQRGALEDVHDGVAVGGAGEDAEVALGELPARVDARAEVVELGLRGQLARDEQVRDLLIAEASLVLRCAHEIVDVVATIDEVALVGDHLAVDLGVAVHVRDGGETDEHARSVGVTQTALDVVLLVELGWDGIDPIEAVVEPLRDGRHAETVGRHRVGVGNTGEHGRLDVGKRRTDSLRTLGMEAEHGHLLPFGS